MELGGKTLVVDPNQSDEEILASLEDALSILQDLFGVAYSHGNVTRDYSGDTIGITVNYFSVEPGGTDDHHLP